METWNEQGGATVPPPPPPSPRTAPDGRQQERQLQRPTDDRMVFGVAAGLGRYLGVDPVVVRIAFVLLTVFGGSGILLYLIGLIAIPEGDGGGPVAAGTGTGAGGQTAAVVVGVVLIAVGCLSLVGQLLPGLRDLMGPLVLLGLGALVIVWGGRR
jgi:phage shock protein C